MNQDEKIKTALRNYYQGKQVLTDAMKNQQAAIVLEENARDELVRVMKSLGYENKTVIYQGRTHKISGSLGLCTESSKAVIIEDEEPLPGNVASSEVEDVLEKEENDESSN